MVERNADTGPLAVRLGNEEMVVQRVAPNNAPPPTTLMFVIDGSARLAGMGMLLGSDAGLFGAARLPMIAEAKR